MSEQSRGQQKKSVQAPEALHTEASLDLQAIANARAEKRTERTLTKSYAENIDVAVEAAGLDAKTQKSMKEFLANPWIKAEIVTQALQISGEKSDMDRLMKHVMENKDALTQAVAERQKTLKSLKGKKSYWIGQLTSLTQSNESLSVKAKQIKDRVKQLEREERTLQKARLDLQVPMVPGSLVSVAEVNAHPGASESAEEFPITTERTTEPYKPLPELLAEHGHLPPPAIDTEASDAEMGQYKESLPEAPSVSSEEPTRKFARPTKKEQAPSAPNSPEDDESLLETLFGDDDEKTSVDAKPLVKSTLRENPFSAPLVQSDVAPNPLARTDVLNRRAEVAGIKMEIQQSNGDYFLDLPGQQTAINVGPDAKAAEALLEFAMKNAGKFATKERLPLFVKELQKHQSEMVRKGTEEDVEMGFEQTAADKTALDFQLPTAAETKAQYKGWDKNTPAWKFTPETLADLKANEAELLKAEKADRAKAEASAKEAEVIKELDKEFDSPKLKREIKSELYRKEAQDLISGIYQNMSVLQEMLAKGKNLDTDRDARYMELENSIAREALEEREEFNSFTDRYQDKLLAENTAKIKELESTDAVRRDGSVRDQHADLRIQNRFLKQLIEARKSQAQQEAPKITDPEEARMAPGESSFEDLLNEEDEAERQAASRPFSDTAVLPRVGRETVRMDALQEKAVEQSWIQKAGQEQFLGAWNTITGEMGVDAAQSTLLSLGVPKNILQKHKTPQDLFAFNENPGLWAKINGDAKATREALNRFIETAVSTYESTLAARQQTDTLLQRSTKEPSPKGLV